ncbi:hypothetical protein HD554DRAFT_2178538 [Boletus coccyginus]|nr:hypothetical protein HD554DRAFT_2178538 [Boletus coccyginus]
MEASPRTKPSSCSPTSEQEQEQHDQEQAKEDEDQRHRQAEEGLLNAACLKDWKKNKAKYNPVHDIPVPSGPIIIPCTSTQVKMKKGSFCDLWYFSNRNLKIVEKCATVHDDLNYVAIQYNGDNSRVLIVTFASELPTWRSYNRKDETHKLILDDDLS